jgi:hypothetical protein
MPYNGSGTYTLPLPGVVGGSTISSTWANATLGDIRVALSSCLVRDGQAAMSGPLAMGSNAITGLATGTNTAPALRWGANSGWYYSSDAMRLAINGVESLVVSSTAISGPAAPSFNSLNADNLNSGTVPSARMTGAYTGITQVAASLSQGLTLSGAFAANGISSTNAQSINSAGEMYAQGWFRSQVSGTGWYHQVHGGGIYMEDATYVRVYGSKQFWVGNHIVSTGRFFGNGGGFGLGGITVSASGPSGGNPGDLWLQY